MAYSLQAAARKLAVAFLAPLRDNYLWTLRFGQCDDRFALCANGIGMDLDWLKDFLALAEQKNFSRAADMRNVSQPAFSRRIRALEEWVGTPLFVRGAQGAQLTPAGDNLRPQAIDLIGHLERARRSALAAGGRKELSVSIAATHALSFTFFPGWVRHHLRLDAIGMLNLVSDNMDACEEIMVAGEVHFLLCHFHRNAPTRLDASLFPSIAVGDDQLTPVCAPDQDGRPLWPLPGTSDRPARCLTYSQASGLGRILSAHPAVESAISTMEPSFTSHHAAALLTMAVEGHGVAWLPRTLIEGDLERGRLVRAGPERFDIPIEIRLFRSLHCRNSAADALWNRLENS